MSSLRKLIIGVSPVMLLGLAIGCSKAPEKVPELGADHKRAATQPSGAEQEKIKQNFAKLSDADREAAEKQKLCPVSDEPLGGMGAPYKVTVNGQDVFLCCQGCEGDIKAEPDKFLAKLKR